MSEFFRKRPRPTSLSRTTSKRQIYHEPMDIEVSEENSEVKSATSSDSVEVGNMKEASIQIKGEDVPKPLDFLYNCGICGRALGSERDIYIYRKKNMSDSSTTNNTESLMSTGTNPAESATSSSVELNAEELKRQLAIYEEQLRRSYTLKKGKDKNKRKETNVDDEISRRKKFLRAHDKILNNMLRIMDTCKTRGFVYGIVTESGKPVSGASDSLRAWWKEKVRFDVNGPAAVDKFYNDNSLPLGLQQNERPKSMFEMLMELSDMTLGSILSLLMQQCEPPQRKFPLEKGIPPPWWPKGIETWLDQSGIPSDQRTPPFKKPHDLRKAWKVSVLIAVIKHMSPDFSRLSLLVENSKCLKERMRAKEIKMWGMVIKHEVEVYSRDYPDRPQRPFFQNQGGQNNVVMNGQNTGAPNALVGIQQFGSQVRIPHQSHTTAPPTSLYPMQQTWPVINRNYNFGTAGASTGGLAPRGAGMSSSLNRPFVALPPIGTSHGNPLAQNQPHGVNNEFMYNPIFLNSGNDGGMNDVNSVMNDGNPRGGNSSWFF